MTPKERIFADEFVRTRNATEAYMAAFPSTNTRQNARVKGCRLRKREDIQAYIDEQLEAMHCDTIADAIEIRQFYTSIMRGELTEEKVTPGGDVVAVHASIADRLSAATKLAKMLGVEDKISNERFAFVKAKAQTDDTGGMDVVINV